MYPFFTIITPVLNNHKILRCVNSITDQSFKNYEHLIMDGNSNQEQLNIYKKFQDKRTKIFIKKDMGLYYAINSGIQIAKGQVIAILGADDFYPDSKLLEKIYDFFKKDDDLSLVYGNINYINKKNKILRQWNSNKFSKNLIKNGWMPPHPSMFVKKLIYDSIGDYDTKYKISSDYDFILKVFFNEKIKSLFNDMVFVRMEVGGISNRNIKNIIRKSFEDLRILISYSKNPIFIARALILKNLSKIKQFFF